MHRFYLIKNALNQNNDYQYLKITCYVCNKIGHISINCPDFHKVEGNLKKFYERMKAKQESKKNKKEHRNILDDAKIDNDDQSDGEENIEPQPKNLQRRTMVFENKQNNPINKINLEKLEASDNSDQEEEESEQESPQESKLLLILFRRRHVQKRVL